MTFFAKIASSVISSYCKVLYNSVAECFHGSLEFHSHSEGFQDKFRFRSDPMGLNSSLVFNFLVFHPTITTL